MFKKSNGSQPASEIDITGGAPSCESAGGTWVKPRRPSEGGSE